MLKRFILKTSIVSLGSIITVTLLSSCAVMEAIFLRFPGMVPVGKLDEWANCDGIIHRRPQGVGAKWFDPEYYSIYEHYCDASYSIRRDKWYYTFSLSLNIIIPRRFSYGELSPEQFFERYFHSPDYAKAFKTESLAIKQIGRDKFRFQLVSKKVDSTWPTLRDYTFGLILVDDSDDRYVIAEYSDLVISEEGEVPDIDRRQKIGEPFLESVSIVED